MVIRKIPKRALAPTLLICCANLVIAQATSRVRIEVFSPLGERFTDYSTHVPAAHVSGEGHSFDVKPGKAIELAYGTYTVSIAVPGAGLTRLSVLIDQPKQVVTVGLRLGTVEAEADPCFIYGTVTPPSAVNRIRAVELFGSYSADVYPDTNGGYEIRNLACGGEYLLMVMGHEALLKTAVVRAKRPAPHTDIKVENHP
jgi:hypothetical protein